MREIVFDTETTGFTFGEDRMVEIGCVELVNRCETGRTFQAYFHPERAMPPAAYAIHGLSDSFLSDKPLFGTLAKELLDFLGDAALIAHNSSFDYGFLNGELGRCGHELVCPSRLIDTVELAKRRHPGAKFSLDALCGRYGVDRSHRTRHGALLDAQLLAQVYVELTGGRQIGFSLTGVGGAAPASPITSAPSRARSARHFAVPRDELDRHRRFVGTLVDPLWTAAPYG